MLGQVCLRIQGGSIASSELRSAKYVWARDYPENPVPENPNPHIPAMPLGLITFHHFHSKQKLAVLRVLTSVHSLQGLFQRGRPGLLIVSGSDAASVDLCVAAVKVQCITTFCFPVDCGG